MTTLTYLQPGQHVLYAGRVCTVERVTDCDARLRPIARRLRTFTPATGPSAGRTITLRTAEAAFYISPNSELQIL